MKATSFYYTHIWRVYDTFETVTLNRESQFIFAFMNELCKLTEVKQKLLTVYYSQTDDNTKVLNQYID